MQAAQAQHEKMTERRLMSYPKNQLSPRRRRCVESLQDFAAMIECVRISARRLPGRMIDDGGKPLTDRGIEAIMTQLDERCEALAAAGLTPGSPTALRVFN